MTGTGERSMAWTMERVESSRPPGVPMDRRTAGELRRAASAMPRSMYPAEMGWMVSWRVSLRTGAGCAMTGQVSRTRMRSRTAVAEKRSLLLWASVFGLADIFPPKAVYGETGMNLGIMEQFGHDLQGPVS